MKKLLSLLIAALCLTVPALAETGGPLYPHSPDAEIVREFSSDTLIWSVGERQIDQTRVLITTVWMADPGQQIGKATADWEQNTVSTIDIARRAPQASLIINGSGYVTKTYKWIPENYPGTSPDYYNTPLGSITVTDGEVFRCLEGVPYYGLTLNTDGLRLHIGEDPEEVLAQQPTQTWSFYEECPVIADHQSILDPDWKFTNTKALRTVIAKLDANNYLILTVASRVGGLTMAQVVDFLLTEFNPEWAYNLDGGPSSALVYRSQANKLRTLWKSGQNNVDIMTFSELPEE